MVKTELKIKKTKRARKFVKDKAIVNFLLEHMKPAKIDFSKIRVPSFLNFSENEEKNSVNSHEVQETQNTTELENIGRESRNIFLKVSKN